MKNRTNKVISNIWVTFIIIKNGIFWKEFQTKMKIKPKNVDQNQSLIVKLKVKSFILKVLNTFYKII